MGRMGWCYRSGYTRTRIAYKGSCRRDQLTMSTPKGLMVVANRLPFTAVRNGPDSWLLQSNNAGGLVTALQGISIAFETV
ncbi:hypothetical protein KSS87_009012 [Heliosperma pusillum]|nr:hypothetical protein KSS87_009012 [Heliosperma pusillum]